MTQHDLSYLCLVNICCEILKKIVKVVTDLLNGTVRTELYLLSRTTCVAVCETYGTYGTEYVIRTVRAVHM